MRNEQIIYLSLGSNLGDKHEQLVWALEAVTERLGKVVRYSAIYESAAWGYASEHTFYNCCLSCTTLLEPLSLMERILETEQAMGRVRTGEGYQDRKIDIDLLFYGSKIIYSEKLTVPHPEIGRRRFVLVPMNEIAPGLLHPLAGITIQELLLRCKDPAEVRKLSGITLS